MLAFVKNMLKSSNIINKSKKINRKDSEDTKEGQIKHNIFGKNQIKIIPKKNDLVLNLSKQDKFNMIKKNIKNVKSNNNLIHKNFQNKQRNKKLKLRKDLLKNNVSSQRKSMISNRNTIEREEDIDNDNIMNINFKK